MQQQRTLQHKVAGNGNPARERWIEEGGKKMSTGGGEDAVAITIAEERLSVSITGGCDIGGDPPPLPLTGHIIVWTRHFNNQKYPDSASGFF
jgi:hypothetical protein